MIKFKLFCIFGRMEDILTFNPEVAAGKPVKSSEF